MNRSLAVADLEVSTLHPVCRIQMVTARKVHGRRDSLAATRTLFLNAVALKQFSENVPLNLSSSAPLWKEWAGAARLEECKGRAWWADMAVPGMERAAAPGYSAVSSVWK